MDGVSEPIDLGTYPFPVADEEGFKRAGEWVEDRVKQVLRARLTGEPRKLSDDR